MNFEIITEIIQSKMKSSWTDENVFIEYENFSRENENGKPFVRFQIIFSGSSYSGLGTKKQDQRGYVLSTVFVPLHIGIKKAMKISDLISEIFQSWQQNDINGNIVFRNSTITKIENREEYLQVNVEIPFTFSKCN